MPDEPQSTPELRRTELKPTKAEVRRRIDISERLLLDCATISDTVRYFTEKEGLILARRTVERYRMLADKRIVKAAESIRSVEIARAKVRYERCFARAMSGRNPNIFAAIAAQKAIANLLGLNAPKEQVLQIITRQEQEQRDLSNFCLYFEGRELAALSLAELDQAKILIDEGRAALVDQRLVDTTDPRYQKQLETQLRQAVRQDVRIDELQIALGKLGLRIERTSEVTVEPDPADGESGKDGPKLLGPGEGKEG